MSVDTQPPAPASQPAPPAPPAAPPEQDWVRSRVDWASVPKVNLLPPEILAGRRFRVLRRRLGLTVLGVLGLAGCGVFWAQAGVSSAQTGYHTAQARGIALQHQQAPYARVPTVLQALDDARATRAGALGTDVSWYGFLTDLAVSTPANAQLSAVSVTMNDAAGTTPSSVPLEPAGIGQVQVIGVARYFPDVATWLESTLQVSGLGGPTLQTSVAKNVSSTTPSQISFTGTVVVTPAALSHRYDREAS
jgi:Tfp pilus assembly protein PilN